MSNNFYSFSYIPARQGFDNSSWSKIYGDVAVSGTQLVLTKAAIIHYGDILRGDATFSLQVTTPVADDNYSFGFIQYNRSEYILFNVSSGSLSAITSDGNTSISVDIPWQPTWTSASTDFRIQWEAGRATFYVNGVVQAVICDSTISGDPLSLYMAVDVIGTAKLNYITVSTIQSFVMSTGNENSSFEPIITESSRVGITELVAATMSGLTTSKADTLNVSEDFTVVRPELVFTKLLSDSLNITDGIMDPGDIEVV